jgi:hypothetical protein
MNDRARFLFILHTKMSHKARSRPSGVFFLR